MLSEAALPPISTEVEGACAGVLNDMFCVKLRVTGEEPLNPTLLGFFPVQPSAGSRVLVCITSVPIENIYTCYTFYCTYCKHRGIFKYLYSLGLFWAYHGCREVATNGRMQHLCNVQREQN